MKWRYCNYCPLDGTCENQDRGHECEMPVKKLLEENQQLKELLKECKCEFEEITKFCNKEIEYAHKQTNNFCIPAEGLAIILHSTDNKELLTKIDNAIGEKK